MTPDEPEDVMYPLSVGSFSDCDDLDEPINTGGRATQAISAELKALVDGVLFHYFCCNDGGGEGCGYLRRDMARLALLIGFESDPATDAEIKLAAVEPHRTE